MTALPLEDPLAAGELVMSTLNDTVSQVTAVDGDRLTCRKISGDLGWAKEGDVFPESTRLCRRVRLPGMIRWASLSTDGRHRLLLVRQWDVGPRLLWVMLNPSLADADVDDQTMRRVMHYSRAAGYAGCTVANLFTLRTPYPKVLRETGPRWRSLHAGDSLLREMLERHRTAVVAWGSIHPSFAERADRVVEQAAGLDVELLCLGTTMSGAPRHPSRLGNGVELRPWVR